ncbi:unnamed protein product [Rhizophagus irregularis]|nr:unnamed protein product [Rhizophagus irregularis]
MSIKKQYEYQTVKITVKLGDRFDRSFQNGQFGIIVIGVFIRWYDGKSRVKGRRERDKWQLWMDVSEIERKAREQMMNRNTLKPFLFSLITLAQSYLSVPDPLGHGWSLDGLVEKEANMSKEVIHPSVKPEEVVKVIDDLRKQPTITLS